MPSDVVSFVLPIPPSVNHMYRRYRNKVVLTDEARNWKEAAHLIALAACDAPFEGAVVAVWEFYFPNRRHDASNCIKALEDALQGAAYINDRQIVEGTYRKFIDRDNPRVEVALWEK